MNKCEYVLKNLKCSDLIKQNMMKKELIVETNFSLYLQVNDKFIYIDGMEDNDFKIMEYLTNKEVSINKGIFMKGEDDSTLDNIKLFKAEIENVLRMEDNFLKIYATM